MIIEYGTTLFHNICIVYWHQNTLSFDEWLAQSGGKLNISNRPQISEPEYRSFYKEDYIEFANEQDYLMFAMKYL